MKAMYNTQPIDNICSIIALICSLIACYLFGDKYEVLTASFFVIFALCFILRFVMECVYTARRNDIALQALLKEHGINKITVIDKE